MTPLFDSNIVIDFLDGNRKAVTELSAYQVRLISIISWMEVLVGSAPEEAPAIKNLFSSHFTIIAINEEIAGLAVEIRRKSRMKLPDAIILATAQHHNTLLVTRNSKDFPKNNPAIRIPYEI